MTSHELKGLSFNNSLNVIYIQLCTAPINRMTMTSNLSKIKPKLRTTGNVTGNFGRPKAKAGSSLNDITAGNIGITQDDYLAKTLHCPRPCHLDKTTSVLL